MLLQFRIKSLWFKSFKFFNLEKLFNFPMNLYIHSNKKKKSYLMDGYIIMSEEWPSWSWSYGSWIYNYLHNQCLSPLTLWVWILLRRGVLHTTLCDKSLSVACSRSWFSLGTPISSTSKTDSHDITEMWLKMALNTITLTPICIKEYKICLKTCCLLWTI